MSVPRGLSAEERAAWARLAESVTPLAGRTRPVATPKPHDTQPAKPKPVGTARPQRVKPAPPARVAAPSRPTSPKRLNEAQAGLDSHWERRFKGGRVEPDLTLDLHGHTLGAAYTRISAGLDQARAMGARVVLVIAGRERPVDPADRASARGAIRAKLLDWLAAGPHADAIAAVRKAHRSHGGDGALYLILKRKR
ncbi:MAG: Smr/MutS family protein [Erythrobacter sp.]|uniref:Smr/MutS family protein n=1 Tax=Erythrobacter sp. TaxID=1042 RepID=UPI00261FA3C8|nr:Smr/MutS family protein [Erythrobacter sp.]MDJ0979306.1 Smr/MutS family protein [Erythrobacter sp.]